MALSPEVEMTRNEVRTRKPARLRGERARERRAIALALARHAPRLARTVAELLATLGALGVVVLVAFVVPERLSAALVAALLGGAALLGRRVGRRGVRTRPRPSSGESDATSRTDRDA